MILTYTSNGHYGIELSFPVAPNVLGVASCTKNGRLSSDGGRLKLTSRDSLNHAQDSKKPKIQAIAYKNLLAHRFPNNFEKFWIIFL